ncbi:glutathione ABC transporter substrate-binding protein [Rossellomorea vietnamensis]|uniref:Glutathione ABC transporter substrate-binding protein n=1 Tax=Rossellomorea vietnamensis TaxID=218284 RepID=A0A5D4NWY2_9BACI|nr:glutathione ABC transporter substrate-binding protein [Rossellomorea vietnamensis]TYS17836.1 glutathione ABC transporter substrate-binding protein [Rossellomorea vietnamensis]
MKKWLAVLLTAMLALAAGCSSNAGGSSGGSASGGDVPQELTYASTSDIVGLSPIGTNDSVSSRVIEQVYETLFVRNPETMEVEPKLAESYETPDENTWVIKLKEDIQFTDGTPLNAEAVKYTFDKFRDPETAAPRASLLEPISEVNVVDEFTVEIKTEKPYGAMLAALSHTNASIVSPEADQSQDLMKEPVGTGPFKFVSWTQGDQVVLEKNADYWQGEPSLEKVTFKVVPEVNTAISMLQTGDVQFIDGIPSDQLKRVESLDNVEVTKNEGTPMYYMGFNMEREPMKDLEFRQAAAYALDREAYVNKLNGLGVEGNSVIGPKVFGFDESANESGYSYDFEKAKELVEANGYGEEQLTILTANTEAYMMMAEIAQSQLTEAGFNVEIESMEWGTFLDTTKEGNFDITFMGWSNSTADGSELLYPNFHSDNIDSSNKVNYSNPEFDALVDESRQNVDQEVRQQKLDEANKLLVEDATAVIMHHGVVTAAYDKSVKGLEVDPTGQWSLYNVSRE